MNPICKIAGLFLAGILAARAAFAQFGVGNIDSSVAIERVAVSNDGRLHAWNKEGVESGGWPKDFSSTGRYFSYGPRLVDIDLDFQMEIAAVSENRSGGNLKLHVFKGNGAELGNWGFDIPHSDLVETPLIADVNHDSSPDVIYSTISKGVHVFRRDFKALPNFAKSLSSVARLTVADLDNDGLDNLYAASGNTIYEWDTQGNVIEFYSLPSGEEIVGAIAVSDINKDNHSELVFSTSRGRILGVDMRRLAVLEIKIPSDSNISSGVVVDDIDVDKTPEIVVSTDKGDVLAYNTTGDEVSSWGYSKDFRESPVMSGVIADDRYRGLFSTATGLDQSAIYRTRHNSYSRIKLGENVHEWDTFANFDYLQMIDVFDVFTYPKPFTPNGDGVNDVVWIHYRLSEDALVALDLYDAHEHFISRIKDKELREAGERQEEWSGFDIRGTKTTKDDLPLETGLYIIKIVAESLDGFVTVANVSAIVNGVKAEIETPRDEDRKDAIYPKVFGRITISGIAVDPNFGEDSLDADYQSYKLYYRPGAWDVTNEEVVLVGAAPSLWRPVEVPLEHQCPKNDFNEPVDAKYPHSNVSCRPVQHGVLGVLDASNMQAFPNGEYTILLKVLDSNGNAPGKVSYDALVVTLANPKATDPYDESNLYDINNPNNPIYKGPKVTNAGITNTNIDRVHSSTTISYSIENETANIRISFFPYDNGNYGAAAAIYTFNRQAPSDGGNPVYQFTWNGKNTLDRNVCGGNYRIRIEANAIDGTGADVNESLSLTVVKGFASSDILNIAKDDATGAMKFTTTPSSFNPLGFGSDLQAQKTHISYALTKEAKVTLQVLENVTGEGLVLRKTISSDKIRKYDDGTESWDGTGDNGLILPVGRDYIVRLTAESIDIGNEDKIVQDITVHLEASSLNTGLPAYVSQLRGDEGEVADKGAALSALSGNPDFLWRADATGYVQMPFSYTISASGRDSWSVRKEQPETYRLYTQKFICGGDNDEWIQIYYVGHIFPYSTDLSQGIFTASVPIEDITVLLNPDNDVFRAITINLFDSEEGRMTRSWDWGNQGMPTRAFDRVIVPFGSPTKMASKNISAFGLTQVYVSPSFYCENANSCPTNGDALDQCYHYRPEDAQYWDIINSGALHSNYRGGGGGCHGHDDGESTDIWDCGSVSVVASSHINEFHNWGPYSSSGSNTIVSTSTNPHYDFASYSGQKGNGGESPEITGYSLSVSNVVNGNPSPSNSSSGSTISLPGLEAWLNGGSISARVPFTTYSTMSHDPYLQGAPFKKISAYYNNFNDQYYRRTTSNIYFYGHGYQPNVFNGNPGTNIYSFSDAVRLNSWNVEVRYPNISVTKPDGDNALNTGSGALGVFAIDELYITPAGVRGTQNSNTTDYFRLRLLPEASPKKFVEIRGTAGADYELFYYDASKDDQKWHAIEPRTHNPVTSDLLAHWDVTRLNGEQYTVVLRTKSGSQVNIATFDVGIGTRVDTSRLRADEFTRVYSPFKRVSLIFGKDSLPEGPQLITISPVTPSEADFRLPTGIAPLGPIFDIKPDGIKINPDHHIQLEITYTPDELREAFGVSDASILAIYNLAGDELLEGLVTIATFDDMDDDDPTNDVWRFTASLEHFSQYVLAKKSAGYFHIDSPLSDTAVKGVVKISGRVEKSPRPKTAEDVPLEAASLTSLKISFYPKDSPGSETALYSASNPTPGAVSPEINADWDTSGLNGDYILRFEAEGPQGPVATHEIELVIDNSPSATQIIINGQAVADGGTVYVATGATAEIKSSDSETNAWQTGVKIIEFAIDGGVFQTYTQPFVLDFANGVHSILYRAVDNIGNIEPDKSAIIRVQEKIPPSQPDNISLTLNISGPLYSKDKSTWVNETTQFAIAATGDGRKEIKYRVTGSEYLVYNDAFTIAAKEEGPYIIEYFNVDSMGMRGEIYTKDLLLDITPPKSEAVFSGLSQKRDGKATISPDTKINLVASDLGESPSGVERIEYKLGDGAWVIFTKPFSVESDTILSYRSADHLGNIEEAVSIETIIDKTPPEMQAVSLPTVISPNGDERFDAADFVIKVSDNLYPDLYFTLILKDSGGNDYTVFDGVKLNAGENKLKWDGKIGGNLLPDGVYTYSAVISDAGQNKSSVLNGTISYDMTPPVVDVINGSVRSFSPNGDEFSEFLQVDFRLTDNVFTSDVAVTLKILSDGNFEVSRSESRVDVLPDTQSISWNGTNAQKNGVFDGKYTFELTAMDPAGNISTPRQGEGVSSGEVFVDRFAPKTKIDAQGQVHDDGEKLWLGRGASIRFVASDPIPASGVGKIYYYFDSGVPLEYTQPLNLAVEFTDYRLSFFAEDMVGNKEPAQNKIVRLDVSNPATIIEITDPKEKDEGEKLYVSPKTKFVLTAGDKDGVGVDQIYYGIEGVKDPANYEEEIVLDGLGGGGYKLLYWSDDLLGNTEDRNIRSFVLDVTPPATKIVIGEPKYADERNNVVYVRSNTPISFEAVAERNDLAMTEFEIDGGNSNEAREFTLSDEKEYLISFRSRDRLGNEETSKLQKIIVDDSAPIPSLDIAPDTSDHLATPLTLITLGGTDTGSSVKSIEYKIDDGNFAYYNGPFSLKGLSPGAHTITYRVTDWLGNVSENMFYAAELMDVLIKRETGKIPRILAFMLQTQDLRKEDPKPDEELINSLKIDLGGYLTVIGGDHNNPALIDEFLSEMRSDKYNIFIFTTDALAISFYDNSKVVNMLKELKSRIYRGDVFITMLGESPIDGSSWADFISEFIPDTSNYGGNFGALEMDVSIQTLKYGKGKVLSFGGDTGKLSFGNPENSQTIKNGLVKILKDVLPVEDQYNTAEVAAYTLTFDNHGARNVALNVEETLPSGWINASSIGGESLLDGKYTFDIDVPANSSRSVDYLYRASLLEAGQYSVSTVVNAAWANGLKLSATLESAYKQEKNLLGLIDELIGFDGKLQAANLPTVAEKMEMLEKRLALGGDRIKTSLDIDALVLLGLEAIDELKKSGDNEEIHVILSEIVENLGAMQAMGALQFDLSVEAGDPNDPNSYHGDTTSYMGSSDGGCSLCKASDDIDELATIMGMLLISLVALAIIRNAITPPTPSYLKRG